MTSNTRHHWRDEWTEGVIVLIIHFCIAIIDWNECNHSKEQKLNTNFGQNFSEPIVLCVIYLSFYITFSNNFFCDILIMIWFFWQKIFIFPPKNVFSDKIWSKYNTFFLSLTEYLVFVLCQTIQIWKLHLSVYLSLWLTVCLLCRKSKTNKLYNL